MASCAWVIEILLDLVATYEVLQSGAERFNVLKSADDLPQRHLFDATDARASVLVAICEHRVGCLSRAHGE